MSEQISVIAATAPFAEPAKTRSPAVVAPTAVVPPAASSAGAVSALEAEAESRLQARLRLNLSEAVERMNEQMRKNGRGLNFSVDQLAERVVITVKDTHSGEVIRQIPDEALLRVAHNIEEIKGLLYNDVS